MKWQSTVFIRFSKVFQVSVAEIFALISHLFISRITDSNNRNPYPKKPITPKRLLSSAVSILSVNSSDRVIISLSGVSSLETFRRSCLHS